MTIDTVHQLPRSEKLKLMETLWEELSQPDTHFESPAWHAKELAETERRLAEGKDWTCGGGGRACPAAASRRP